MKGRHSKGSGNRRNKGQKGSHWQRSETATWANERSTLVAPRSPHMEIMEVGFIMGSQTSTTSIIMDTSHRNGIRDLVLSLQVAPLCLPAGRISTRHRRLQHSPAFPLRRVRLPPHRHFRQDLSVALTRRLSHPGQVFCRHHGRDLVDQDKHRASRPWSCTMFRRVLPPSKC